ncbi:MAG TPA: biotin synthase [Rhodoferax sp.]|nr:biotin synthase [Rhodoferax sp.]
MTDTQPPTLDPQAARRWQHLPGAASPWLHEEVAQRMQERLDLIKCQPAHWIDWQPGRGGLQAHGLVARRYPKATCLVFESSLAGVQLATQALVAPRWNPKAWLAPKTTVAQDIGAPAQMLWSNMALHMAAEPLALLAQWHQALEVDGFLMFSCLGPDSLKEMRSLYQSRQWPAPAHAFTDMHDWGDMLLSVGFAEPVMDVERITLTFETPERLLQELRGLGRNLYRGRFAALRGRHWQQQLCDALASQPLQLTFEVIYGHAFKPSPKLPVSAHSAITLDEMRAALQRSRGAASASQASTTIGGQHG